MKKRILVLCTGNSCRSQMAEGVLRHYRNNELEVESAGSQPSQVNKIAIQVMQEIGINISQQRSKHVQEFLGQHFDYVITVCDHANETCPIFPGEYKRLHWPFPDPPHQNIATEAIINEFRKVRDMIYERFMSAGFDL